MIIISAELFPDLRFDSVSSIISIGYFFNDIFVYLFHIVPASPFINKIDFY